MLGTNYKGNACFLHLEMGTEILYINRQICSRKTKKIKEIFVDETLLKINGQDYWLWIAYEPICMPVCYSIYLEKELFLCVTSFSGKLEVDMEARLSIRMVHIGTRLLVNG